ncbi:MAG: aldo/keto reductase [Alphaproteobacteria bacterium]
MEMIRLWNGMEVPRVGLGCWAIGGPFAAGDTALAWGRVDDRESIAALHRGLDLGVRVFDTADVYGTGHSEEVLGRALKGFGEPVVIVSKFGNTFDAARRQLTGHDVSPAYIRAAVEGSLRRLGRERIDLYLLHVNDLDPDLAAESFVALEDLRRAGKIDGFGWSTDHPASAARYTSLPGFVAIEHDMNLLLPAEAMLALVAEKGLLSIPRQPLGMGLLTGKYAGGAAFPADDIRARGTDWMIYFRDGRPDPALSAQLEAVRGLLTADGRTLAQGALGWVLARSAHTLPVPGFKTVAQVEEDAATNALGALPAATMAAIERTLGRHAPDTAGLRAEPAEMSG